MSKSKVDAQQPFQDHLNCTSDMMQYKKLVNKI